MAAPPAMAVVAAAPVETIEENGGVTARVWALCLAIAALLGYVIPIIDVKLSNTFLGAAHLPPTVPDILRARLDPRNDADGARFFLDARPVAEPNARLARIASARDVHVEMKLKLVADLFRVAAAAGGSLQAGPERHGASSGCS